MTFSKEQLIARINQVTAINKYRISRDQDADGLAMDNELFSIALASLEAEPVAVRARWKDEGSGHGNWKFYDIAHRDSLMADETRDCELIYSAPASAAMLQGAEPVTTAYKLRDAVETIRNSGIEINAEKIFAERDALNAPDCWCRTCRPITLTDMRFVVCPDCGNKRCPHANDHRNACTGSNEPGQEGSAYPAAPQQEVTQALAKGMERYGDAMNELAKREVKP